MLILNNKTFLLGLYVSLTSTVIVGSEISFDASNAITNGTLMPQKTSEVYSEENDDTTNETNSSEILHRKKRWVNILGGIWNY